MDNGETLEIIGYNSVMMAYVVSGGELITMMVGIYGRKKASIQLPLLILKNATRSFPITEVEYTIPEVCYLPSPKGWMDSILGFHAFLKQVPLLDYRKLDNKHCLLIPVHHMYIIVMWTVFWLPSPQLWASCHSKRRKYFSLRIF